MSSDPTVTSHPRSTLDAGELSEMHARVKARDEHVRENWIRAMEAKLVADELSKCRRSEGVNSYETCKDFAERYLVMLKDNRVKGYKNVDV